MAAERDLGVRDENQDDAERIPGPLDVCNQSPTAIQSRVLAAFSKPAIVLKCCIRAETLGSKLHSETNL